MNAFLPSPTRRTAAGNGIEMNRRPSPSQNGDEVLSAGVLGEHLHVAPFQVVGNVTGFAITEEVAGGVVTSQNPPTAVWLIDA